MAWRKWFIIRFWWVWVLLAILSFVIYSNSFEAPFVLDDVGGIKNDQTIRYLTWDHIQSLFFQTRGLTKFTFTLTYALGGLSLPWHHGVSFGIHVVSSWLLFGLSWALARKSSQEVIYDVSGWKVSNHLLIALATTLIFAVHPLQTNGVTFLSQRLVSLATLFYLAALLCYCLWRERGYWAWAGGSLVATILAMHSKEISATIPLAILFVEFFFFTPYSLKKDTLHTYWKRARHRYFAILPWLILLAWVPFALFGGFNYFEGKLAGVSDESFAEATSAKNITGWTDKITRTEYLFTQFNVVRTYWRLLFFPIGLNLDYDYPTSESLFELRTLLSLGLLLAIAGLAGWLYFKNRLISFGIFFVFLALSITSSLVPLPEIIFEYRLYLPMVGFSLALSSALLAALERWREKEAVAPWFLGILIVLIGLLSWMTWQRNFVWANDVTLWNDVIKKSPNKSRAYNNLGAAYLRLQEFDKAEEAYRKEIELNPTNASPYNNIGGIYGRTGRFREAQEMLEKALELKPDHDGAYNNIGSTYATQGDWENAVVAYEKSLAIDPEDAQVLINLGDAYRNTGRPQDAIEAYGKGTQLRPDEWRWRYVYGMLLLEANRTEEARKEFFEVLRYQPDHQKAMAGLGDIAFRSGDYSTAEEWYRRAIAIRPAAVLHASLGAVLHARNKHEDAIAEYRRAVYLNPNTPTWFAELAEIYEQLGDFQAAQEARKRSQ